MSGPPTLSVKGSLVEHEFSLAQSELDTYIPLDYIMLFYTDKILKPGTSMADRVLIGRSSTGSGKSTMLPPEFYHLFNGIDKRNIACTQPRILNALSVPREVVPWHTAEHLKSIGLPSREPLIMGKNIGYQTGNFMQKPPNGIIYMTIGILQAQLNVMTPDSFMDKYSIIFVDEAHERSINLDNTLFMLKQLLTANYTNPKCPFVMIMSATLDTREYADYMLSSIDKSVRYKNIVEVKGNVYEITDTYLDYPAASYVQGALDILTKIHEEHEADFNPKPQTGKPVSLIKTNGVFRDILIFISGADDAKLLLSGINKLNVENAYFINNPVMPLFLSGEAVETNNSDYRNAFEDFKKVKMILGNKKVQPTRRIIIATNTAETGVTIPTLRHVIDTGYYKSAEYNPSFNFNALVLQPTTQNAITQRRGRVGRKFYGFAWYAYTEEHFKMLRLTPLPEVLKESIDMLLLQTIFKLSDTEGIVNSISMQLLIKDKDVLKMLADAVIDFYNIDFFTAPSIASISASLEKLFILGAITSNSTLTPMGIIMSRFNRLTVEQTKMILASYAWKAATIDLITIAACMSVRQSKLYGDARKKYFKIAVAKGMFNICPDSTPQKTQMIIASDFIQLLIIYESFAEYFNTVFSKANLQKKLYKWCNDRGIKLSGMNKIIQARDDIISRFAAIGLNPYHNKHKRIYSEYLTEKIIKRVKNIKYCIYEGYKNNMAVKISRGKYMAVKSSIKFDIRPDNQPVFGLEPQVIVFAQLFGPTNQKNMYEFFPTRMCILDGYVPIDLWYDTLQ